MERETNAFMDLSHSDAPGNSYLFMPYGAKFDLDDYTFRQATLASSMFTFPRQETSLGASFSCCKPSVAHQIDEIPNIMTDVR